MNRPKYILDSYALLAYFQAEPAGAKVRNILKDAAAGAVEDVVNKKAQLLGIIDGGRRYAQA